MAEEPDFEPVEAPERLRPWVRRYLYANRPLTTDLIVQAKPTGFSYFSNFFGGNGGDYVTLSDRATERRTRWFVFGQITDHDVRFRHRQSLSVIIAELTPTAHHRLFGTPGSQILGMASELVEIAPECATVAGECFLLGSDASRDRHVHEANTYFTRLAEKCAPADDMVGVVRTIEMNNGAVRIAALCKQAGIAPRELRRRFHHAIGISPKFFAQVTQIKWAIGLLASTEDSKLANVALEAGFYDQAHFNRAMHRFFSESPRDFVRSGNSSIQTFLAEARHFGAALTNKLA